MDKYAGVTKAPVQSTIGPQAPLQNKLRIMAPHVVTHTRIMSYLTKNPQALRNLNSRPQEVQSFAV